MKNNPRAVLLGWSGLAGCALGGYLFAKFYTGSKLRKYSDEGGFGSTTASSTEREPGQRSVNRRL
ncbi:hypothetical protein VKS41_007159 [Umbelopsis sp. WA50703]